MRLRLLAPTLALLAPLSACDRPPSPDSLREWTAADHDRVEETNKARTGAVGSVNKATQGAALVEAAWKAQCQRCHGSVGRGDGPEGPMNKAFDLTNPAWQNKMSDAEITATIRTGKGKMPKFDLPDAVVAGLVARIRAAKAR